MPVMSEFQEERDSVKQRPFKERFAYFWDYYKWYVIGGTLAVIFAVSLVRTVFFGKDTALYVAWINFAGFGTGDEEVHDPLLAYLEEQGLDTDKYDIIMDSTIVMSNTEMTEESVTGSQKLAAYIAAKQLDSMVAGYTMFMTHAYQDLFLPLSDYMSEEEIAALDEQGLLFYIDTDVLEAITTTETVVFDDAYLSALPDPTDPDSMTSPVAVGVRVDASSVFPDSYYLRDDDDTIYAGALINSTHADTVNTFIHWLLMQE
jgi:hypothetical protein